MNANTPRCSECKRTDVPVKPANEYMFLIATGKVTTPELLCRACAGLVYFDLTGSSLYVMPLDLQAHFMNHVES